MSSKQERLHGHHKPGSTIRNVLESHHYDQEGLAIGLEQQARLLRILDDLTESGFIAGTRPASKKQRKNGVHFFCRWVTEYGIEGIPVRVTTSSQKMKAFEEKFGTGDSIRIVIRPSQNDEEIKTKFLSLAQKFIESREAGMAELVNARV